MSEYHNYDASRYEKPIVPVLTKEMSQLDAQNVELMGERSKLGILASLAIRHADKEYSAFVENNTDGLHELALYENALYDVAEWKRPKYLDEFTENEIAGGKRLEELADEYMKDSAPYSETKDQHYERIADSQHWAIEQLDLSPGEVHRLTQAINARNGNPSYYGAPSLPSMWRKKPVKD